MSLPIKKIYVDTKYKSAGSESNSNFKIDLPVSLAFPENTGFYIDDVCIPHSWYVIEENVNDKLYFVVGMTVMQWLIVKIESGNYNGQDLALEIQTKIRAAMNIPTQPTLISATYNTKFNNISISTLNSDWYFHVMTPADIK